MGSSRLVVGLDFGHCASICVDFDQLPEVCLTSTLPLPTSGVDISRQAICSVPALSDHRAVDMQFVKAKAGLDRGKGQLRAL